MIMLVACRGGPRHQNPEGIWGRAEIPRSAAGTHSQQDRHQHATDLPALCAAAGALDRTVCG